MGHPFRDLPGRPVAPVARVRPSLGCPAASGWASEVLGQVAPSGRDHVPSQDGLTARPNMLSLTCDLHGTVTSNVAIFQRLGRRQSRCRWDLGAAPHGHVGSRNSKLGVRSDKWFHMTHGSLIARGWKALQLVEVGGRHQRRWLQDEDIGHASIGRGAPCSAPKPLNRTTEKLWSIQSYSVAFLGFLWGPASCWRWPGGPRVAHRPLHREVLVALVPFALAERTHGLIDSRRVGRARCHDGIGWPG